MGEKADTQASRRISDLEERKKTGKRWPTARLREENGAGKATAIMIKQQSLSHTHAPFRTKKQKRRRRKGGKKMNGSEK